MDFVLFFIVVVLMGLIYNGCEINRLVVSKRKIVMAEELKGLKLVHLSDLHIYGRRRWYLTMVESIRALNPDVICITGDLIDRRIYKEDEAVEIMAALMAVAPIFFVPGNHEYSSGHWGALKEKLLALGVQMPRNNCIEWVWQGERVEICGLNDRLFYDTERAMKAAAKVLGEGRDPKRSVLLTHRPDRYYMYQNSGFGLVLAGHIHGGIIGLPNGRGVVQKVKGVLPPLTRKGIWGGEPPMIISRGIGNTSIAPVRVFNPPEIVLVEFVAEE